MHNSVNPRRLPRRDSVDAARHSRRPEWDESFANQRQSGFIARATPNPWFTSQARCGCYEQDSRIQPVLNDQTHHYGEQQKQEHIKLD